MSVLLSLTFAVIGGLAMMTMIRNLRCYGPMTVSLYRQLRTTGPATQVRFTLLEHMLVRLRPNRGPLRHRHRPKPITHRLNGPKPRRATA